MEFLQSIYKDHLIYVINMGNLRVLHIGMAGCNIRCKECVISCSPNSYLRKHVVSDTEQVAKLITETCREHTGEETNLVWFGTGESFMQKDALFDIVRRIPEDIDIGVSTNGTLIPHTEELNKLFDTIAVSLYFVDPDVYLEYTSHPLQPVLDNLKWLADNYKGALFVQFAPFSWFYDEEKTHEWCRVVKSIVSSNPRVQIRGNAYVHAGDKRGQVLRENDTLADYMKIIRQYFRAPPTYSEIKKQGLTKHPYLGSHQHMSVLEK